MTKSKAESSLDVIEHITGLLVEVFSASDPVDEDDILYAEDLAMLIYESFQAEIVSHEGDKVTVSLTISDPRKFIEEMESKAVAE